MSTRGERFLLLYSTVLTAVFVVTVLCGFDRHEHETSIDVLNVQRINLREPDGTLRMVMADSARAPGSFVKGREYPRPDRKDAGLLFLNAEGSENGGLIFGGERGSDGVIHSSGHLSFDAYEQDQMLVLDSSQDGDERQARLVLVDNPAYSLEPMLQAQTANPQLPGAEQHKIAWAYARAHGLPVERLVLGRGMGSGKDSSVQLALNDTQGHPRIVLKVASDGTPSMQMLDAHGKVLNELVPKG